MTELDKKVAETFEPRVNAAKWNALSDEDKRRRLQELIDERTARIELRRTGVGTFEGEGSGVEAFRILLTPETFDEDAPIVVRYGRRTHRKRARVSRELLLTEFAERFDRTFLPVAEVTVKP